MIPKSQKNLAMTPLIYMNKNIAPSFKKKKTNKLLKLLNYYKLLFHRYYRFNLLHFIIEHVFSATKRRIPLSDGYPPLTFGVLRLSRAKPGKVDLLHRLERLLDGLHNEEPEDDLDDVDHDLRDDAHDSGHNFLLIGFIIGRDFSATKNTRYNN